MTKSNGCGGIGPGRRVGVASCRGRRSDDPSRSDLAVDTVYQGQGIGRELIRRTHEAAGDETTLILLAAPKARTYHPHIGMRHHDACWVLDRAR